MFVGVNVVFFPHALPGPSGHAAPLRRLPHRAFTFWNQVSTYGYMITAAGVVVFLVMLAEAAADLPPQGRPPTPGARAPPPWSGPCPSPPPFHQFNELPVIHSDGH